MQSESRDLPACHDTNVASKPLPRSVFDTDTHSASDRWAVWRDSISVIFDVAPPPGAASIPLFVSVDAYHLGSLVFGDTRYTPQAFDRSSKKIARDGVDHFLVQLYPEGGYSGIANGKRDVLMRAGDICLLDLGQTLSTRTESSRTHTLVVPRAIMEAALPHASALHGTVLRRESVFGKLLSDHFTSLCRHLPQVGQEQAAPISNAALSMISACFCPATDALREAHVHIDSSTRNLIKRHIDENFGDPALTPETVGLRFRVSRTTLYRLFEPLGGVGSYIQHRRLQRAYVALSQPSNRQCMIYKIAYACGFKDEAHFSRSFRRTFGVSPSDVRPQAGPRSLELPRSLVPLLDGDSNYSHWIADLLASA